MSSDLPTPYRPGLDTAVDNSLRDLRSGNVSSGAMSRADNVWATDLLPTSRAYSRNPSEWDTRLHRIRADRSTA